MPAMNPIGFANSPPRPARARRRIASLVNRAALVAVFACCFTPPAAAAEASSGQSAIPGKRIAAGKGPEAARSAAQTGIGRLVDAPARPARRLLDTPARSVAKPPAPVSLGLCSGD